MTGRIMNFISIREGEGGRGNYSPEPIVFNLKLRYFSKTRNSPREETIMM